MTGSPDNKGLAPRGVDELFRILNADARKASFQVCVVTYEMLLFVATQSRLAHEMAGPQLLSLEGNKSFARLGCGALSDRRKTQQCQPLPRRYLC